MSFITSGRIMFGENYCCRFISSCTSSSRDFEVTKKLHKAKKQKQNQNPERDSNKQQIKVMEI